MRASTFVQAAIEVRDTHKALVHERAVCANGENIYSQKVSRFKEKVDRSLHADELIKLVKDLSKFRTEGIPAECILYLLKRMNLFLETQIACREDEEFEKEYRYWIDYVIRFTRPDFDERTP
jgi:hypothetical protein